MLSVFWLPPLVYESVDPLSLSVYAYYAHSTMKREGQQETLQWTKRDTVMDQKEN